jgi:molybdopterin-guanine dinucleotide biosynthesis protein
VSGTSEPGACGGSDAGNPFATRFVRPGAIPYLFRPGESLSVLIDRLAAAGWRGEITGPHGSGKSTLLAALIPAIERTGREVILVQLHDGERRLPRDAARRVRASTHPTVLVIDGYEQLPWWRRRWIEWRCRRRATGLLVTSHRSVGLPELARTRVEVAAAQQIVAQLLAGREEIIAPEELAECVARHGNDLRETLFDLYDLFELRRS